MSTYPSAITSTEDARWAECGTSDEEQANKSHRRFCVNLRFAFVVMYQRSLLTLLSHPFLAATILVTDINDCMIGVSLKTDNCDDLRICCFRIVSQNDLVTATQKPIALRNAIKAPLLVFSILAEEMLTSATVAANRNPHAYEIILRDPNWSGRGCRR